MGEALERAALALGAAVMDASNGDTEWVERGVPVLGRG